jgi:putative DNA methylase
MVLEPLSKASLETTRSINEVQSTDADDFARKLGGVLTECRRVLKDEGLLVFTYHHSRADGWYSVYEAIRGAGFTITNTQPVKGEMSVSVPVQSSRLPINYDLIIVCRKDIGVGLELDDDSILKGTIDEMQTKILRLRGAGLDISLGDAWVIAMGALLTRLSSLNDFVNEKEHLSQMLITLYPLVRTHYSQMKH